jgi:GrpB-like predicted nucleotidyltransferase (UPF0157 family)
LTDRKPMTDAEIESMLVGDVSLRHEGTITLVDYDPQWPLLFEREAARIRRVLGEEVRLLEHAGSTSIPGLGAKPRIDIVLAVRNSADESTYVPQMEAAGYPLRIREPDWHEHRVFKGPDTDINLHVFTEGSLERPASDRGIRPA